MICVSFFAQYLNECVYACTSVHVYMYHCAFLNMHMYQINEGTLSTGEMYEYSLP